MLPAGFEGHHDAAGRARNKLRRQARNSIRLMHAGRDAELRPHFEGREAGIATGADDHVGLKVLQDTLCFGECRGHTLYGHEIVPDRGGRQPALVVGDLHGFQPEALARDNLVFHAVLRADKEDLTVRLTLTEHTGDRNGGIDMPARATAGKDDIHELPSLTEAYCRSAGRRPGQRPLQTAA